MSFLFPPGSAPARSRIVPFAGTSTTSNTTGVLLCDLGTLHGTYIIYGMAGHTTAATTTAARFSIQGTAVASTCVLSVLSHTSATAVQASNAATLGGWTAGTSGPGTTARPVEWHAVLVVTTPGTVELWLRSEIGASAVTVTAGALLVQAA